MTRGARKMHHGAPFPVNRPPPCPRIGAAALLWLALSGYLPGAFAHAPDTGEMACVPVARWMTPTASGMEPTTLRALVDRAAAARTVLLGESHDSAEHHRWQLQVLTALHAAYPEMVIALEMFPRRVQPALDRWSSGEIDEAEFLEAAQWRSVWNTDAALYLPIFHFARMNRIPLVAINVDRTFTRSVAEQGLAGVPVDQREGIGEPAPAPSEYEQWLFETWRNHQPSGDPTDSPQPDDTDFRRFAEAQLVWDRAMAEGIADALRQRPGTLVAALMGTGHVIHGWGVSHQLQQLARPAPLSLLPWDRDADCSVLVEGYADAVFGVAGPSRPAAAGRPRLGITIGTSKGGILIGGVLSGSIAAQTGLRTGDLIVEIAGQRPAEPGDVAATVARQAPGTWLPLKVQRDGETLEFVAKFPPAEE